MDDILEYASSPSPPSSPPRDDVETRRQLVAQRLAAEGGAVARRGTREEDAFAFHGYSAKRRRRHAPSESQRSGTAETCAVPPLLDSYEDSLVFPTTDSEQRRVISLRRQTRQRFIGHSKAVNELQWHPTHPQLFLSASMDATVRVWKSSVEDEQRCQRELRPHSLGVKSAKWSLDGRQILSGGYDGMARCTDVETGRVQQTLRRPDPALPSSKVERITTVHFHPTEPSSMLLGTDQGHIYCHDLREKTPHHAVTTYSKSFSDVHDLLFLGDDGQRFVSSAGVMQRDASNQTLLVWDWRSATLLYDRLDSNMLAHSCLRAHPTRPYFVAQCSGNYATLYSSRAPYKSLKGSSVGGHRPPLRFAGGHEVQGYRIQCSFSRDGALWASGDANGRVVLYRTSGKRGLIESFQLYGPRTACVCAEFQPSCTESDDAQRALLTGSSGGDIDLFRGG